jgi:hypothetical protein
MSESKKTPAEAPALPPPYSMAMSALPNLISLAYHSADSVAARSFSPC